MSRKRLRKEEHAAEIGSDWLVRGSAQKTTDKVKLIQLNILYKLVKHLKALISTISLCYSMLTVHKNNIKSR